MKKLLSIILTLIFISGIGILIWQYPEFCQKQVNKVIAVWYVYKGDKYYKQLKMNRAIKSYQKALELYPEHYGAWNNLGNIYVVYEDYFSAVDAYEQAFEHNPKMIVARMNYGIVSAQKLGDFDGAINQYDEILKIKRHLFSIPLVYSNRRSYKANRGLAYYNKGVAYKQKSIYLDYEYENRRQFLIKALEAYKQACKILKWDYDARYNLALTYHLLGDYPEAGLAYCKAIEISPMKYDAHYNLAILLMHLKYYKESLDELKKATELLIDSSDNSTERQRYIFDVMYNVTRTVLSNEENELVEELPDEDKEPDLTDKLTYVKGKIVMSKALDNLIMKNLKRCKVKKIFKEELDATDGKYDYLKYNIDIPREN